MRRNRVGVLLVVGLALCATSLFGQSFEAFGAGASGLAIPGLEVSSGGEASPPKNGGGPSFDLLGIGDARAPYCDPRLLSGELKQVAVPGLTARNRLADAVHLALGVATVLVGGATGIVTPEEGGYNLHHALGWTTAGLAAGTLLTGAWAHHDEVGIGMGLIPSNVHALLGIVGGLLMIAAPLTAPGGGGGEGEDEGGIHAALGIGGEVLMGVAIAVPLVFRPAPVE